MAWFTMRLAERDILLLGRFNKKFQNAVVLLPNGSSKFLQIAEKRTHPEQAHCGEKLFLLLRH
tara:strand:+ start:715 stop:903 length:189 start_codon:yes stop_codon:yes gene_type:complete